MTIEEFFEMCQDVANDIHRIADAAEAMLEHVQGEKQELTPVTVQPPPAPLSDDDIPL